MSEQKGKRSGVRRSLMGWIRTGLGRSVVDANAADMLWLAQVL
jgi:hypothetical protein